MSIYRNDRLCFVRQAVESVLSQTCPDFDFYIHADGPLAQEVDAYLSSLTDPRVRFHRRDNNLGLAATLNEILTIVLAEPYAYMARMDADDICKPERLEKQLCYMQTHLDVDCLGTWAEEILADGSHYYDKQMPADHDGCLRLFHQRDCIIHPTAFFRRSFFEKAGLYSTATYFAEDTMLWAQGFANGCRFANLEEYLYQFRLDEHFFSRRRGWKHAVAIYRLRRHINKQLHFGFKANCYALGYALAKIMPTFVLNILYKTIRK